MVVLGSSNKEKLKREFDQGGLAYEREMLIGNFELNP